jgi:hypothetical protein
MVYPGRESFINHKREKEGVARKFIGFRKQDTGIRRRELKSAENLLFRSLSPES